MRFYNLLSLLHGSDCGIEEEDVMVNETILQNLGCIEVTVYRVKRHGIQRAGFKSGDVKAIGAINEKSKKAGSHCVS